MARSPAASTRPSSGAEAAAAVSVILLFPAFFPALFSPLGRFFPSVFSEWSAPHPMHSNLFNGALVQHVSDDYVNELWSPLPSQGWKPCSASAMYPGLPSISNGYIQVFLDGGLNQQRMGICDAVAVAKILNATLVIPHLEENPVWRDSSSFEKIFDVAHFTSVVQDYVPIIRQLPKEFSWSTRDYYGTGIRPTRIKTAPSHASAEWYLENVIPILRRYGIAAIAPFSHRLAFENLPSDIQHLRCKVNYEALQFVPHIVALGETIVQRVRYPVKEHEEDVHGHGVAAANTLHTGKYVVLHLRFDKDMAAHSSCDFGGGRAERLALAKYRQVIWQGRVVKALFTDKELRSQGRCPLTPEETGLLLAALGFDNRTRLYLASHKVYGGEARISSLQKLFPLMVDKKSLASNEELAMVSGKASLLAAVDYYVSMQSDIFVSASPGNMHNAMLGHRAYKNLKTIKPNMPLLSQLFLNKSLEWPEFQQAVRVGHRGRHGEVRLRKPMQSIYTYPAPDCMCKGP